MNKKKLTQEQQEALDDLLSKVARNGKLFLVKFLVKHGANIHADGDYALRVASLCGYLNIVKFLIEHGANIHWDDNLALWAASYHGHFEVVKYLVECGADIHADNSAAIKNAKTKKIKEYLKSKIQ